MKKILSLFLVIVMVAMLLASCTSSNNSSEATTQETAGTDTITTQETLTANETTAQSTIDSTDSITAQTTAKAGSVVSTKSIKKSATQAATKATTPAKKIDINIGMLKGPTGIGAVKLMDNNKKGTASNYYNFSLYSAPEDITAKVISGELDIAAVPTNLASVLYNKTNGGVQIAALNTLGVLSVVEIGNKIHSISDLKGKTIYASGQGATPEYVLNYILKANGIANDVTVVYKSEHAELATLMASGQVVIGVLPEPFVTSVLLANSNARIALDLTDEWTKAAKLNGDSSSVLSMGCIIVNTKFAKENKASLNAFLNEYRASIAYAKAYIDNTAALCETYGIMPKAAVAKKAIPNCNLCYIDGSTMKTQIKGFFNVLYNANPKSIGGKLPDDAFYYKK